MSDRSLSGSGSSIILPVATGLVLGIAFIVSFALFINTPPRSRSAILGAQPISEEFKNVEQQIPEVKLFLEKYGDYNSSKGFGRFPNGTIEYTYVAAAYIDKNNGDGIKEKLNRRIDLTILYDESGSGGQPIYKSYDPSRVKQIEIRCRELTELTPDVDKAFTDVMPPAYDGRVKDFIQHAKCLF